MKISDWYVNPDMKPAEIKKRVEAAEHWLKGVEMVVDRTKDKDAKMLFQNMLVNPVIVRPDAKEFLVPVQGPEDTTIFLVPLFEEDTAINDTTRMVTDKKSGVAAYYTENTPGRIYFNADMVLSPLVRGLLILHETSHAAFFQHNIFRDGDELDYWNEETEVFELEFRLLAKLGGTPYKDLLKKTVASFKEEYESYGALPDTRSVDVFSLLSGLGPCQSDRDKSIRQSIVWIDAAFKMFEEISPKTATKDKAIFLRNIHRPD